MNCIKTESEYVWEFGRLMCRTTTTQTETLANGLEMRSSNETWTEPSQVQHIPEVWCERCLRAHRLPSMDAYECWGYLTPISRASK